MTAPTPVEAMEELSQGQIDALKRRAKSDLFFLAKTILGYDQVDEQTHGALCAFLVHEPANRRMVLMPRGFLKSTLCTITDSTRQALINPNVRILIANETYEKATDFLKEIKGHWRPDSLLGLLFPELLPPRTSGPGVDWAQDKASVNRPRQAKESTWNCIGVGGTAVSSHFERIKCDDLAGAGAKASEAVMQRAVSWLDDLTGLLDNLSDTIDLYGTRKTMSDVYAHAMDKWKNRIKVFMREPLENGVSIFPKMPTEELMNIMLETPDTWAHDYMNNPIGKGGTDWGKAYTQYFTLHADKVTFIDPLTKAVRAWRISELDIVITVDPNSGKPLAPDKAAVVVHGVSPLGEIFILQSWSARPSPQGLIDKTWELCQRWRPRVVGFEDAGQQNTLFYFIQHCQKKGEYYSTFPLKHKNKQKELRIRTSLDTPLKGWKIFFQRDQLTLLGQIQLHPQLAAHNWDEIDCLANGAQLYRDGVSDEDNAAEEEAIKKVSAARGITGYGHSCHRPQEQS